MIHHPAFADFLRSKIIFASPKPTKVGFVFLLVQFQLPPNLIL